MRIYDENDNLMDSYDESKGRLVEDQLFICHHEAVEAVEEQGHWETIAEYPNGGKDVDWIVDVQAVKAQEAWDEYEDIYRYIPYTEEELAECKAAEEEAYKNSTEYRVSEMELILNALLGA